MSTNTSKVTLEVEGMTCGSCVAHVESRLRAISGVMAVEVRYPAGTAEVVIEGPVDPAALVSALDGTPYSASAVAVPAPTVPSLNGGGTDGYDIAVLGGGSAGFAAAIRAVEKGARVVIVNEGTIGGTCVNVGCVPSKTLLRAAEARHRRAHHHFHGVGRSEESVDWKRIRADKDGLVTALRTAKYEDVLAGYDEITLLEGRGVFDEDGGVSLSDGTPVPATSVIIATGSSPRAPAIPGLEEAGYLDSTRLMDIDELPESLAVIGAGPAGLELAQVYSRLGVRVTILARSRLLSKEDSDVGQELATHLMDEGIEIFTDVSVHEVERTEVGRRLHLTWSDGSTQKLDVQEILVASGRRPNTSGMGLEEAGVELGPSGEVLVDSALRTSNARVFAAGDVTGEPMHVYVAAQAAGLAAENALGGSAELDVSVLPAVTFTDPGVASVGLTEDGAREAGIEPIVSKLGLEHVPRSIVARDTRGFIKLVADAETRRIIGAHIVASEAGEMIMEPALAVRFGLTVEDLTSTLHPYLTLSEGIKLAALTFDKDVATLSCCAV